jgi:thioredoxin-related protein
MRQSILVEFADPPQKSTAMILPLIRILTCLFCLPFLPAAWAAGADGFFDQTLGDFQAELAAARDAGKQGVLLMFEAEGCPYCRKMRTTVLNRHDVQSYYRRQFMVFSVDILGAVPVSDFQGRESTEKRFAEALRVRVTPTFLFVAPDGSEMLRYSGATRDADEFLRIGKFVAEGLYRRQSLDAYLLNSRDKP